MQLLVVLDPVTSFLFHLFHDLIAFVTDKILLDNFSGCLEIIHKLHAGLSPFLLGLTHLSDWVPHLVLDCHRTSSHAKEVKLFLAQFFDLLARQNTFNALLNEKRSGILLLFGGLLFNEAFTNLFI
jgi:hypothetical protein